MSKGDNSKSMKRTDTNRSGKGGANDLQRTTSSYHGSVAEQTRYSDRLADREGERDRLTASQLNKSKTLEERLKQAERENVNRRS